jgi:hypothetical protein
VALADDFLPFYPGYLFDTHFMERGRFGRLLGLLAHWEQNNDEKISGIGIDDQSAFCIDAQGLGTAFGSGGVYIYKNGSFDTSSGKPVISNVISHQLQEGDQYHLIEKRLITGPSDNINVDDTDENLNANLYLSGVNWINSSSPLLDTIGKKPGKYLIVSKAGSSEASSLLNNLENQVTSDIVWLETKVSNNENDQVVLRNNIRDSKTVIFIDNNDQSLHDFLINGPTGELLATHIFRDDMYLFFLGNDAKLAAKTYVANNEANGSNAYRGDLTYEEGLGILKNMIVMPNTYDLNSSDFYENNSLSVLYALGKYGIKRGLYLTDQSVISFTPGESIKMQSWGEYSSILVTNTSNKANEFQVEASSSGPRNNFSFDSLQYNVFSDDISFDVGKSIVNNSPDYEYETPPDDEITSLTQSQYAIEIFPNPASNYIKVISEEDNLFIRLVDVQGKVALEKEMATSDVIVLNESLSGLHILQIFNSKDKKLIREQKIVLEK